MKIRQLTFIIIFRSLIKISSACHKVAVTATTGIASTQLGMGATTLQPLVWNNGWPILWGETTGTFHEWWQVRSSKRKDNENRCSLHWWNWNDFQKSFWYDWGCLQICSGQWSFIRGYTGKCVHMSSSVGLIMLHVWIKNIHIKITNKICAFF